MYPEGPTVNPFLAALVVFGPMVLGLAVVLAWHRSSEARLDREMADRREYIHRMLAGPFAVPRSR